MIFFSGIVDLPGIPDLHNAFAAVLAEEGEVAKTMPPEKKNVVSLNSTDEAEDLSKTFSSKIKRISPTRLDFFIHSNRFCACRKRKEEAPTFLVAEIVERTLFWQR